MICTIHIVAALAVLLMVGGNPAAQPAFDYGRNLGIALDNDGRVCLEIDNEQLARGQIIRLINTTEPMTTGEAKIQGVANKACVPADQNKPGVHHYELKVINGVLSKAAPAFAVVGFSGPLTVTNTDVTGDLDNDGHSESFRSCTTTEGVYMTVWKGKSHRRRRKWRYYFYLGYDVSPTCTKLDTRSGSR